MKIECTKTEQEWLIDLISEQCRGGVECEKYSDCEECIKDNIQWMLTD